jgi:uncharacterized protein YndB with AHSA1/START domain
VDRSRDLTLTRLFRAGPDAIYACWTEARLLTRWFTPPPVITREAEVDPRPGGVFRTVMLMPDGTLVDEGEGCVLVAEPGRRFAFTDLMGRDFRPAPAPGLGFTADIRLSPEAGGTRYHVTVRHGSAATRTSHEEMGFHEGWSIASAQLGHLAETL